MSERELKSTEIKLSQKEKRYSELMRRSFEVSLDNRERARTFHTKAKNLYREIMEIRRVLNYA